MSVREFVILGTAAQVPTRYRNHNGYFLRWDEDGFLFDPGEGTQRQMIFADISSSGITHLCLTHFHGDHCLGLPGVIQRLSLDQPGHHIDAHYPASGENFLNALLECSAYQNKISITRYPLSADGARFESRNWTLYAEKLDHRVESWGYRLVEHDSHTMLASRCEKLGIRGAQIGKLKRDGFLDTENGRVMLEDVSEERKGQRFAFIMDTRPCEAACRLAQDVDMLVCEATYATEDAKDAYEHHHMTMGQAAELARDCNAKQLILSHFSQRYANPSTYLPQLQAIFPHIILARDLDRIPFPKRHRANEE